MSTCQQPCMCPGCYDMVIDDRCMCTKKYGTIGCPIHDKSEINNMSTKKIYVALRQENGLSNIDTTLVKIEQDSNIEKCKSKAKEYAKDNPGKYVEVYELKYRYRMEEVKETKYGE